MRQVFLIDQSIEALSFDEFKRGLSELATIDRIKTDVFIKSPETLNSDSYARLYQEYSYENQEIAKFIEQLTSCDQIIDSEIKANTYCNSKVNGFLGVDFIRTQIPAIKQVWDQSSYSAWSFTFSNAFGQLEEVLGDCFYSDKFSSELISLSPACQESIIDLFERAKNRNLMTSFYPDTKIIKDVSDSSYQFHLRELRVYTPVALRVYFHESSESIFLAGIALKSNPNQSGDIVKMYKRLKDLIDHA